MAAVNALRTLDGKAGVTLYTYSLSEDSCVRLLAKNLGRRMPETVVREKLDSLDIHVQGVMQLRSARSDYDPAMDHRRTLHFIVSVARGPELARVRSITELCGLLVTVNSYVAYGPMQ
jgi:hypothetical protein